LAEACREKPQWMRRKLSEEAAEAMEKAPGLEKWLYPPLATRHKPI